MKNMIAALVLVAATLIMTLPVAVMAEEKLQLSADSQGQQPDKFLKYLGSYEGNWVSGSWRGWASLNLTRDEVLSIKGKFMLYGTGQGTSEFERIGTLEGDKVVFKSPRSKITLQIREGLASPELNGEYEITQGKFAGERGTYYFKKGK